MKKPLPEISGDKWDVFTKYADDRFRGDWGLAFEDLVEKLLIEPEWYIVCKSLDERIYELENSINETCIEPQESLEEGKVLGRTCDGNEVKE